MKLLGGTARTALLGLAFIFCCAALTPALASAAGTGEIGGHIEEAGSGTPISDTGTRAPSLRVRTVSTANTSPVGTMRDMTPSTSS